MNLLVIVPYYYPAFQFGGPIFSIHVLNKFLTKKGVNVSVYTTNMGIEDKVVPNVETNLDGVKVYYFSYKRFFDFLGTTGWQYSPKIKKAIENNIKNFDLVHINEIWKYPATIGMHISNKLNIPYIVNPRGALYPYTFGKKIYKKWFYYKLTMDGLLNNASAIHYTTDDEYREVHSFLKLKNKVIIVPNGIDLSEFESLPSKEDMFKKYPNLRGKKLLLFLSRISWIKGLDVLFRAYSVLAKEKEDIHLLIVGKDDGDGYEKEVRQWAVDYGIDSRITFTGLQTGLEKLKALAGSDVFIQPSYSESFGMAVLEAMACGLPVVISDKVGNIYKEVEKNNAGIVVQTNAESLCTGIKALLDNEKLRKEASKNGKRLVADCYSIDKVADRMIESYEIVIRESKTKYIRPKTYKM